MCDNDLRNNIPSYMCGIDVNYKCNYEPTNDTTSLIPSVLLSPEPIYIVNDYNLCGDNNCSMI